MRLFLTLACLALAVPVLAQSPATPPAPPTVGSALSIPVPVNAHIKIEVDARDEDLIGVVKDFLSEVNAQTVVDSIAAAGADDDDKPAKGSVKPKPTPVTPTVLPPDVAKLSLADILHNIKHVHMVVLEIPPSALKSLHAKSAPAMPIGAAPEFPGEAASTPAVATLTAKALVNYYETAFHKEGAHRIIWADYDEFRVLMVGFQETKSSAIVMQMPDMVVILRSDGYPDFKPLNALISTAVHEATKNMPL